MNSKGILSPRIKGKLASSVTYSSGSSSVSGSVVFVSVELSSSSISVVFVESDYPIKSSVFSALAVSKRQKSKAMKSNEFFLSIF